MTHNPQRYYVPLAFSPLSLPVALCSRVIVIAAGSIATPSRTLVVPAGFCVLPLLPYRLKPPSCHLVAHQAGCCMSRCIYRHIVLCRPLVILLRRLVVMCRMPLSPYLMAPPSCPRMCIPTGVPIYSGPHFPEFRIFRGISGFRRNTHRN